MLRVDVFLERVRRGLLLAFSCFMVLKLVSFIFTMIIDMGRWEVRIIVLYVVSIFVIVSSVSSNSTKYCWG